MANFCNHHVMQKFAHRSLRSLLTMFTALIPSFSLADVAAKKFALTTPVAEGFQLVKNEDAYQTERGFGFDAGADKVRFFPSRCPRAITASPSHSDRKLLLQIQPSKLKCAD